MRKKPEPPLLLGKRKAEPFKSKLQGQGRLPLVQPPVQRAYARLVRALAQGLAPERQRRQGHPLMFAKLVLEGLATVGLLGDVYRLVEGQPKLLVQLADKGLQTRAQPPQLASNKALV